jgi:hypothetical protein
MNIPPYTIESELVDGLYVIVVSDDCRSAHLPYDDFFDWADHSWRALAKEAQAACRVAAIAAQSVGISASAFG